MDDDNVCICKIIFGVSVYVIVFIKICLNYYVFICLYINVYFM